MPELPEVETTRCGIEPHLRGQSIEKLVIRQRQLRWPIPASLASRLKNQTIIDVGRRGKYLLINTTAGTVLVHLGMSGSLRMLGAPLQAGRHDHVDLVLRNGVRLRFTDPRRFGAWLWAGKQPLKHKLLLQLGPEPLDAACNGDYLFRQSRKRKLAVKSFLMNSRIVVGVGNIYANEALFKAGVHPNRGAGRISKARYEVIAVAIKQILADAIRQGGTTLRDFVNGEGKPGYFQHSLQVYGRTGQPCTRCNRPIKEIRIGQRSSFYCPNCQR